MTKMFKFLHIPLAKLYLQLQHLENRDVNVISVDCYVYHVKYITKMHLDES